MDLLYKLLTLQCITDRKTKFRHGLQIGVAGLQKGAVFMDYKSGQKGLQIGAGSEITKRSKSIANGGRD